MLLQGILTFVRDTFTVNPSLSKLFSGLFLFQANPIILSTYSDLRYKNTTEDKSFSYLTKHTEYQTLAFLYSFDSKIK